MPVPLDFKDAILAPELLDTFQVIRRVQIGNSGGRPTHKDALPVIARGVVQPFTPDTLRREADMQTEYKALQITTPFLLRGPAEKARYDKDNNILLPDIIVWNKDKYLITALDDYSNYNPGYVKVVAVSLDYVDQAPQGINP
jgi:hypothetical protein